MLFAILAALTVCLAACTATPSIAPAPVTPALATPTPRSFSGQQAYADVQYQVSLGPRLPESPAHDQVIAWVLGEIANAGWEGEVQDIPGEKPIKNIIAKRGEIGPWIILGAHYDSRLMADQDTDPQLRTQPVPGANDGASGVAVLLELARTLPDDLPVQLWLVFFDAEDNGDIQGWDWIMGSSAFVASLEAKPDAAIIIDMIGDANLNLPIEQNSTPELVQQIWQTAKDLGYESVFLNQPGYSMLDDHTPFLQAGIPAVDIIDFDYPYWHTTQDTPDKVSAQSLQIIGNTLTQWLKTQR
jgi:Zn-dependent M28 family amino/carboxypeptidase